MASAARSSFEFSSENAKIADWPVQSAAKPTIQFYKISGSVDPADLRARAIALPSRSDGIACANSITTSSAVQRSRPKSPMAGIHESTYMQCYKRD